MASILALAAVLTCWLPAPAFAAGPWRGQVVDADTERPVSDVVVVAVWYLTTPGIHEGYVFHAADEVVSDAAGRFELPARRRWSWIPFTGMRGPSIEMWKAGYGQWRFRLPPTANLGDAVVMRQLVDDAWKRFESDGAVIEMPPARTPEQRRAVLRSDPPMGVPACRVPRWIAAVNAERRALGLSPRPPDEC